MQPLDVGEREHALVYPVECDDVGFAYPGMSGDVTSRVGQRHLEKVTAIETVTCHYAQSLKGEVDKSSSLSAVLCHGGVVGALVQHEHASVDSCVTQGMHEPSRHYRGTSERVAVVDDYDLHCALSFLRRERGVQHDVDVLYLQSGFEILLEFLGLSRRHCGVVLDEGEVYGVEFSVVNVADDASRHGNVTHLRE